MMSPLICSHTIITKNDAIKYNGKYYKMLVTGKERLCYTEINFMNKLVEQINYLILRGLTV